ncbi:hypothetical protein Lal_00046511 [Lupinus albus]|nr:hypothetical protein Lal_00046511 [Lupinus albus]
MADHVFMPHGQPFLVRRLFESQTMEDEANQRKTSFMVGKYEDVVLCDVVHMETISFDFGPSMAI